MAGFHTKTFLKYDDYMTPKYAWENIKEYIPTDKVIWEAFYGDGNSGNYLTEMGFNVIHKEVDFFTNDLGEIVVSNPPFSQAKNVMNRMLELDKPKVPLNYKSSCNFDCFYYCYKMNLPKDIVWLE